MPVLLGEALSELAWDMELSLSVLQWLSRPCQFALRSLTSTAKLPPFAVRANDPYSKKKSRGCESAPFDFDEREAHNQMRKFLAGRKNDAQNIDDGRDGRRNDDGGLRCEGAGRS
jgi:hypothetical protein